MKKVLWIACLLFVMPFLGYSQQHAGLAAQDDEALFGPGPVSKPLPSHIQLNMDRAVVDPDDTTTFAHVMFIPDANAYDYYGYYYLIRMNGQVETVRMYNNFYFPSAEYFKPYPGDSFDATWPVWAYSADYVYGFHRLMYWPGIDNALYKPVSAGMRELTYDYTHKDQFNNDGRMLGLRDGRIYEVNMSWGEDANDAGTVTLLFDYRTHDVGRPIAMASNLEGELYFVTLSENGATSQLYYFEADDETLADPQWVGDLGWAAMHTQTMAFNHKEGDVLYWWQCDADNNTNLVIVDTETAATTLFAGPFTTEMGGLIFEFEYKPYTAYCTADDRGDVLLKDASGAYILDQNSYLPAKEVEFEITNASCFEYTGVTVVKRDDHSVVVATFTADELIGGLGHFKMPAFDVDIIGDWRGIPHNVTLTWTPTRLDQPLHFQGDDADPTGKMFNCQNPVVVTYDIPENFVLLEVTVTPALGEENPVVINSTNQTISFNMPENDVTVYARYYGTTLTTIHDICQYHTLGMIPNGGHSVPTPPEHAHKWRFEGPIDPATGNPVEVIEFGPATHAQCKTFFENQTFDYAGTWHYTTWFIFNDFGEFPTTTKSFNVIPAPRSIAIKTDFSDLGLAYNPQFNCDGDSIHLEVVADPADYVFNGTFTWTKKNLAGEVVATNTTTEPLWVIKPCNESDGGFYNVTYKPNSGTNAESPCDFTLGSDFEVNVATMPNQPKIIVLGGNPVCNHSSATLRWDNGVLDPEVYDVKWYTVTYENVAGSDTPQEVWTLIEGVTGVEYETDILENVSEVETASYYFGISINYAQEGGSYYLCHRESDAFEVKVKPKHDLEILGDSTTCWGFNPKPENNPHVEGDFTDFVWEFNGVTLAETSNMLHFENFDLVHPVMLHRQDTFLVSTSATDADGCRVFKDWFFYIDSLPDVTITNNINEEVVAHVNDNPVAQIEICSGDLVILTAHGADSYVWGEGVSSQEGETFQKSPVFDPNNVNADGFTEVSYSVIGTYDQSACFNKTTIKVIIHPLPQVAWVYPAEDDVEFSVIGGDVQLEATPVDLTPDDPTDGTGWFSFAIVDDPTETNYPIEGGLMKPAEMMRVAAEAGFEGNEHQFMLLYQYEDAFGCVSEKAVRRIVVKKKYWTDPDVWDPDWYDLCMADGQFEIHDGPDMGAFMAYVYGLNGVTQTDFAGVMIKIEDNIDLDGYYYRPFCDTAHFAGLIDGESHRIYNMIILENNLEMFIEGTIRNLGVIDANITSVGAPCVVDVLDGAELLNSYITMPELNNVAPRLNPMTAMYPTGTVRNVYYYGVIPGLEIAGHPVTTPQAVYMESEETPAVLYGSTLQPTPYNLLHAAEFNTGILEEWVWLQNDFYFRTWNLDDSNVNYGYPIHDSAFVHHHLITIDTCEEISLVTTGIQRRTIKGQTYDFALNNDEISFTFTPDKYVVVDELVCHVVDYHGVAGETTFTVPVDGTTTTFRMPKDSINKPAYNLVIEAPCHRDYWTDGDGTVEGSNYDPEWYDNCVAEGKFEIHCPRELAALAWEVDFGGHTFADTTIRILGAEDDCLGESAEGSWLLDMTGHFWRPIYNFQGILDGTHYIVDNLYIREDESAMFVNLQGEVRNLGIQDADLPEEGLVATFAVNDANTAGSVVNSFATNDPTKHVYYPLAVGEMVTLTNNYTLDENGIMIDDLGGNPDLNTLEAWVENLNSPLYRMWIPDFDPNINYNYPIHSDTYDGGFSITYIPSITDHQAGTTHGYADGPTTAHEGDEVTVTTHADVCYNITKLELIDPELPEPVDIFDTRSFTMPNHPVTVTAEVTPRKYLLTIRYVVDADPSIIIPNFTQQYEYNYTYEVPSPVLTDYEPVEGYAIVTGEMPCKNKTVVVHYIGKKHNITSECANLQDEYNYTLTTNPADEARFGETVTVTVTPPEHVSVAGLVITDANDNPVAHTPGVYDEENGTFTFTFVMPSSDVNVCPDFTEKYWDDYGPADISWFTRDKDVYELTTDSMLGGLAALVSGREWLYDGVLCDPYFTELEVNGDGTETNRGFDFRGITIIVNSPDGAPIDLIEHKWRPIGAQRQYLKQFNGTFDGQNIEIVNMDTYNMAPLDSDENGSCEAFFGNVGRYGQVLNLNISGSATGRYFTAGVAGTNYGIIANCVANVVVRSEFSAGGIVGNNYGIVVNSYCTSPEVNCMAAAASKDANNYFVGGVASYNNGIISNCHSVALLVKGGTMGNNVTVNFGGLVGVNDGEVSYCYWKVNPIAPALGGGTVEATNCNVLNNGSAAALNSRSQALASEYEALEDLTFNGWKQGAEYPVFDLERGIMSSNEHDINVDIYPNPTKGMVYILSENIQRVSVFNMFGQMVLDTEINSNEATINMSTFSAGVYMVRIATAEGITTKNVVVE